ncbi:unnamed protein product, partial [Notodromas monacha]
MARATNRQITSLSWFLLAASIYSWSVIQDQKSVPGVPVIPPYGWRRHLMAPWYSLTVSLASLSLASIMEVMKEERIEKLENFATMSLKTVGLTSLTGELLNSMYLSGFPEMYPELWSVLGTAPVLLYSYDSERHEDRSTSIANLIILGCSFIQ